MQNNERNLETSKEMARLAIAALEDKKGEDVRILDVSNISTLADYFIICSASNVNQMRALVDNVEERLGRAGYTVKNIEGTDSEHWVLMDYGDVIVHVFDHEMRLFYDLERIWRDGRQLSGPEALNDTDIPDPGQA